MVEQSQPKLVPREWKQVKDSESDYEMEDELTVQILTWNILCDIFSVGCFDKVDESLLVWDYRFPLIKAQIDQRLWDFICLQEVDKYEDLRQHLAGRGYHGSLAMKADGVMGCAIFWNSAKFTLQGDVKSVNFADLEDPAKKANQLYLYGKFLQSSTGKLLTVATTHLKAKKLNASVREGQAKELVAFAAGCDTPLAIAGDFNASPDEATIKDVMKSALKSCSASVREDGSEPPFTTIKYRGASGMVRHTIDYVFTNDKVMAPVGWLDLPAEKDIQEVGNPCSDHPSDHYALAFSFTL